MRLQSHIRGIKYSVYFYLYHGALLYNLYFLLLSATANLVAAVLTRAIMITFYKIYNAFDATAKTFKMVVDALTNASLKCICRAVVDLLQSFHYHGKQEILSVLINPESKYTSRFSHVFDRLEYIGTDNYNPKIPSDPNKQGL